MKKVPRVSVQHLLFLSALVVTLLIAMPTAALAATPTLDITPTVPNGDDDWYTTAPTISLAHEAPTTSLYQWDGTTAESYVAYSSAFPALEGEHTLYYCCSDDSSTPTPASLALKVDTVHPNRPGSLRLAVHSRSIGVLWTNPAEDFAATRILRSRSGYATSSVPGGSQSLTYEGTATACTDTNFTSGGTYYYTAFSRDEAGNWSTRRAARATLVVSTSTSLSASPSSVYYSHGTKLTATCRRLLAGSPSDAGATVKFQSRRAGSTRWTTITSRKTNAGGIATLSVVPRVHTYYRAVRVPTTVHRQSVSSSRLVHVRFHTHMRVTSTSAPANTAVIFYGVVGPASAARGRFVYLQGSDDGGLSWVSLDRTRVRSDGSYAMAGGLRVPGTIQLRIRIPGSTKYDTGFSPPVTVTWN